MVASSRLRRIAAAWTLCLASISSAAVAAMPTAEQRTAAEALFQQGRELMSQKNFAAACEKFNASQELDPGLGTKLHLADCYDLAGKTASAWALFREVATAARRAGEHDRQRIAEERAENLVPRLARLELRVAPLRAVAGLELRLNDVLIPRGSWNTPLPLDPGPVHVEARAPGKQPWHYRGALGQGPTLRSVDVPALRDAPVETQSPLSRDNGQQPAKSSGGTQRAVGYVVSATGLVALAVAGAFGYRAYTLNQKSKGQCRVANENACTEEGVAMRDDAQLMGIVSTITSIGGGVLAAAGVTLVLTAPSTSYAQAPPPRTALSELGFSLRASW